MKPGVVGRRKTPTSKNILLAMLLVVAAVGACGTDEVEPERDLQLVGVDFELNSIILTNAGSEDLRTTDVWIYQNGESFQLGIFTIEPRATILFSVRDLGGLDTAGGEIGLFNADDFDDPASIFDYVAWGDSGYDQLATATEGGVWSEAGPVEVSSDSLVILRADPELTGPDAWIPSDEIP